MLRSVRIAVLLAAISVPTFAYATLELTDGPTASELALDYTYLRPNAPPGVCGCFSMNGGSLSFAQPFSDGKWSAVFDAIGEHGSGISAGNFDLTLSVFTLGARYRPWPQSQWSPFGQVLLGVSHASGTLVEGNTPAAQDASLKFASNVGSGIDYWVNNRWSIRAFEADYLLTTYSNRTTDHQNSLRISVGAAFHFGAP